VKTRHVVFGLGVVLALAMAVPALGGPLNLRASGGISKVKRQVKQALIAATSAQRLAAGAQSTANEAQGTASGAQNAAGAAKAAANAAQGVANAALGRAGTAETAAAAAGDKADAATKKAQEAFDTANARVEGTVQRSASKTGGGVQSVLVTCPEGMSISGGGYSTSGTLVAPLVSEPEGNGWSVIAAAAPGAGSFRLTAWAVCMYH
jgi:hypothetical protein